MLEVETSHGRFCYEYEFARAGFVVLRAIIDRRELPRVLSDGKDVTRLAVERAADLLLRQGKVGSPSKPPAHLMPPYDQRKLVELVTQRAEWERQRDQKETRRRAEWRRLHAAAQSFLEGNS